MDQINPWMIVLARESQGMSQRVLANALGIAQGTLSKIENGALVPADDLMEALERKLPFRASFYTQPFSPMNLPTSFYRKRVRVGAARVKAIRANANILRQQIRILLNSIDVPELNLPLVDPNELRSVSPVARQIRSSWGLPPGPIDDLINAIEDGGIVVAEMNFETRQVDAVSMYSPEDGIPPVILVNTGLPGDRLRFSVAHELGHIVMHHHLSVPHEEIEAEANSFAAEFLMPSQDIGRHLGRITSLRDVASLKPHWKVSMGALIERAATLGKISPGRRRHLWAQMSKNGYRSAEPYPIEPERPRLLGEIVMTHLDDLGYSEEELSEVLMVNQSEMRDRLRMTGRPAHLKLVTR